MKENWIFWTTVISLGVVMLVLLLITPIEIEYVGWQGFFASLPQ